MGGENKEEIISYYPPFLLLSPALSDRSLLSFLLGLLPFYSTLPLPGRLSHLLLTKTPVLQPVQTYISFFSLNFYCPQSRDYTAHNLGILLSLQILAIVPSKNGYLQQQSCFIYLSLFPDSIHLIVGAHPINIFSLSFSALCTSLQQNYQAAL